MSTTPPQPNPSPEPASSEDVLALLSHIVSLQARFDALNAMVEVLASKQKIPLDVFRAKMKEIYSVCHQKRLEPIEDVDPAAAAKIDQRGDRPEIDPDLLGDFFFGDGGKSS